MKWLIRVLVVLAVLITGLLWFGYSKIDDLLRLGIEKAGSEALQVPVKIDKVSLSMFTGAGAIEGLEIGTPGGFSAPRTLHIGRSEIAINTSASKEDRIVIQHIRLNSPELHLEVGPGGSNLAQIARNARAAAGTRTETPKPAASKDPAKQGVKLQIDEVLITAAQLRASAGALPGAKSSLTLPEIRLTGLGSGSEGLSPAELTALILAKLSEEAAKAMAGGAAENLLQGGEIKIDAQKLNQGVNELKKILGK
jgi:hypothetical protein